MVNTSNSLAPFGMNFHNDSEPMSNYPIWLPDMVTRIIQGEIKRDVFLNIRSETAHRELRERRGKFFRTVQGRNVSHSSYEGLSSCRADYKVTLAFSPIPGVVLYLCTGQPECEINRISPCPARNDRLHGRLVSASPYEEYIYVVFKQQSRLLEVAFTGIRIFGYLANNSYARIVVIR